MPPHIQARPSVRRDMAAQTLHGSCACGRNRYVVEMPQAQTQLLELRYDNTSASREPLRRHTYCAEPFMD